jgi:NADPH:quinone reductase-like Zn-dependent oxidoreductase
VADERGQRAVVPETMMAIRLHTPGGPEELVVEEVPTPRLGGGEALVRVHAAAITRGELEWPTDRLPAIPAYELSGVAAAVASDVDSVSIDQPVYALTGFDRDGAAAEYVALPAALLAAKPRTLDHVSSASIPLAGLTAWQGLFDHGGLQPGQRVLIHGAAGGVGHFATQLARWRGGHVIGTTSGATAEAARRLGADEVLVSEGARLEEVVEPVDLVFDTAGGELLARSPALVRAGGRLISVAEEPPEIPEAEIRTEYFVVQPNREQLDELGRLIDSGDLRPAIDSVFPLAEAPAAFARSMARGKRGKVVLRVLDDEPSKEGAKSSR